MPALVGGGTGARPGEVSLAHNGVLFLDELPEFATPVLDSLRQPLETGEVSIARANHRVTYPARFQLVAAMNPCRCGHAMEPGYACKRQPNDRCIAQYGARLSGPLLDRIDLYLDVPAVSAADLILPPPTEGSAEVAARVAQARALQVARYAALGLPHVSTNAAAPASVIESVATLDPGGAEFVRAMAERMRLSARGFHRVLKLARTLADLDASKGVGRPHLAEALSYRPGSDRRARSGVNEAWSRAASATELRTLGGEDLRPLLRPSMRNSDPKASALLNDFYLVAVGIGGEEEAGEGLAIVLEISERTSFEALAHETRVFRVDIVDHDGQMAVAVAQVVRLAPVLVDGEFEFERRGRVPQIDQRETVEVERFRRPRVRTHSRRRRVSVVRRARESWNERASPCFKLLWDSRSWQPRLRASPVGTA